MKLKSLQETISYAKFFLGSLTLNELHLWLISPKEYSQDKVKSFVSKYPKLKRKLILKDNPNRLKNIRLTNQKINRIHKLIFTLGKIPTIKLIALTGSLSVNNIKKNDDIDLMIITTTDTLWLTRPLALLITSFLSKRRTPNTKIITSTICTNLWLDEASLTVPKPKQNLYTAHEVLQVRPLLDKDNTYNNFISKNSWVKKYLANAFKSKSQQAGRGPTLKGVAPAAGPLAIRPKEGLSPKHLLRVGIRPLNHLAFKFQYAYMKNKITKEHITLHSAYFHPRDLYPQIKKVLQN